MNTPPRSDEGAKGQPGTGELRSETPSSTTSVQVSFRDCADEATGALVGEQLAMIANAFTKCLPLARLEGFTIAADYPAALQELDRGFTASRALAPTNEDFGVGIGMAVPVLRDGVLKYRVVLHAGLAAALVADDEDTFRLAVHTLVHEFGHVACGQLLDEALPGVLLKRFVDGYEARLYERSNPCWDEYFASKVSAQLNSPQLSIFQEMAVAALCQAAGQIQAARLRYIRDKDLNALCEVALSSIGIVMKQLGYLVGHADGMQVSPFDTDGTLLRVLDQYGLAQWFEALQLRVRELDQRLGKWTDFNEFFSLNRSIEEAANHFGLEIRRTPEDGLWLHVYWTEAEQLASTQL